MEPRTNSGPSITWREPFSYGVDVPSGGSVTFRARISDEHGISSAAVYYVQSAGADVEACQMRETTAGGSSYNYEGIWTPPDGAYKVYIKACDASSEEQCSQTGADYTIRVGTTPGPPPPAGVSLEFPQASAKLCPGAEYTLKAKAEDATEVSFYLDNVSSDALLCTGSEVSTGSDEFSCTWTVPSDKTGTGTIIARAVLPDDETATAQAAVQFPTAITLQDPAQSSMFLWSGSEYTLNATACNATDVSFYLRTSGAETLLCTGTETTVGSGEYSCAWPVPAGKTGAATLVAKATLANSEVQTAEVDVLFASPITLSLAMKDRDGSPVSDGQLVDVKLQGPLTIEATIGNMPEGGSAGRILLKTFADEDDPVVSDYYHTTRGIAQGAPVRDETVTPDDGSKAQQQVVWKGRGGSSDWERILLAGEYTIEVDVRIEIGDIEVEKIAKTVTVEVDQPHMVFTGVNYPQYAFNSQQMTRLVTYYQSLNMAIPAYFWEFHDFAAASKTWADATPAQAHLTAPSITRADALKTWVDEAAWFTFLGHGGRLALYFEDGTTGKMLTDTEISGYPGNTPQNDIFGDVFVAVLGACETTMSPDGLGWNIAGDGADLVIGPEDEAHVLVYQLWCERFWWFGIMGADPATQGGPRIPLTIAEAVDYAKSRAKQDHQRRYPELIPGFYPNQDPLNTIDCVDIIGNQATKDEYLLPVRYGRHSE